jgi:hypothetical protein
VKPQKAGRIEAHFNVYSGSGLLLFDVKIRNKKRRSSAKMYGIFWGAGRE